METMQDATHDPDVAVRRQALSAATATARQRGAGIVMMLTSSASNQTGAALGAMAFPTIGPVGVVAIRQFITALVLTPIVRPRLRGRSRDQWWPVLGLVVVFSVMNLSLYAAIDRIGLGLAVTLEFLGPLTVALVSSRRALDIACAVLAGAGVVVLTNPGPSADIIGIALGLLAATAWGSYILLNRSIGQRLPGLEGTAVASILTAAVWTPIAVVWFATHTPTVGAVALAAACGLMASIVPYVTDLLALRRVPAQMFGTFASINPIWAALAGWLLLHQALHLNEWVGIALIVVSNVVVSVRGLNRGRGSGPSSLDRSGRVGNVCPGQAKEESVPAGARPGSKPHDARRGPRGWRVQGPRVDHVPRRAGASPENRERVFAAAERLGYRTNRTASLLALRRTRQLGVVAGPG